MSHFKEREEKVCLNCNADLGGKYCHECGQENREPKSSAWGLITHFFNDITHFDGKFFSTTGKLLSRPGLLPKEYTRGRRASYLDPIRMYIFSSAIFFLVFFSIVNINTGFVSDRSKRDQNTVTINKAREELLQNNKTRKDSMVIEEGLVVLESKLGLVDSAEIKKRDSLNAANSSVVKTRRKSNRTWKLGVGNTEHKTKEEYDSAQSKLPAANRDNWFERKMTYRNIDMNQRFDKDEKQAWKDILNGFIHTFPYLLFVSLPLFALYLKLLYIRRRKKFYYVDHGIFLIFLYIFTFIFSMAFLLLNEIETKGIWEIFDYVIVVMVVWGIYYAWRAMHKFYEQGRWKTFFKFLLFNLMCLVSIILLFGLFFVLTIFSV